MSDHAIWQITEELRRRIELNMPSGLVETYVTDRDLTQEPLSASEVPAVWIRPIAAQVTDNNSQGGESFDAAWLIDAITDETFSLTLPRRASEILGHIEAIIADDRTLGGMTQPFQTVNIAAIDQQGLDYAAASMETQARFTVARGDHFTLITY